MINKHFFKTLMIFTLMIVLGLVGVLAVSYFSEGQDMFGSTAEVAE